PRARRRTRPGPSAGGRRRRCARGHQRRANPRGGLLRDDRQRDEGAEGHGGNPMNTAIASTSAELLRLRKWPAVWVTISAWLALTVLFGFVFTYVSYKTGDTSFSNEGV